MNPLITIYKYSIKPGEKPLVSRMGTQVRAQKILMIRRGNKLLLLPKTIETSFYTKLAKAITCSPYLLAPLRNFFHTAPSPFRGSMFITFIFDSLSMTQCKIMMKIYDLPAARPRCFRDGVNTYGKSLSSHSAGTWEYTSSGLTSPIEIHCD